jgi:hypothetical protein
VPGWLGVRFSFLTKPSSGASGGDGGSAWCYCWRRWSMRRTPSVAVDDFSRHADLFFLTHAHVDHMRGLTDGFAQPIHCTEQTASLLQLRFPRVKTVELECYRSLLLDGLVVTCIPAAHCPGSVMFKFESETKVWLHTGDFRFDPRMLQEQHLTERAFDEVHLDTTFAWPEFEDIPTKRAGTAALLGLIEEHGADKQVYIECDMLGTEAVLTAVQGFFKSPAIHVVSEERRNVLQLLGIDGVTADAKASRFHFVPHLYLTGVERGEEGYIDRRDPSCLFIKPSMQFFRHKSVFAHSDKPCLQDGVWHCKYSLHSSMAELRQFVSGLRPKTLKATTSCDARLFRELVQLCRASEPQSALKKRRT